MQPKIDFPKIESYSIALSEKLCNDFYKEGVSIITGPEILKFTGVEQLNLFIVKALFDRWKEEAYKLRSPYFDYEQEEVKEAMSSFLNKLSKHISIRKEFFKPLVRKASSDALVYILNPSHYIKNEFLNKPIVSLADLVEREKYLKINKFLIQGLIKKMQLQNKSGFPEQEALKYFEEVYKNFESSLENTDKYIEGFSSILKITRQDLTEGEQGADDSKKVNFTPPIPNQEIKVDNSEIQTPVVNMLHEVNEKEGLTLNDVFAKNKQLSLNDTMKRVDEETEILQKHRKSKIHDLKASVPINLRFIFINELFKGSMDDYNLAITQVERCQDLDSAKNILDQLYKRKYDWNEEKSEVKEFMELVERRFY